MADMMTPLQRHECMSHIRSKDTKPEQLVRQALWHNGYRYRLHVKGLPGKPDIVLPKYRTVIFINGCFWHGHERCKYYVIPKTNTNFWLDKINSNKARDARDEAALVEAGWRVVTIWECELKNETRGKTIEQLLNSLLVHNL